MSPWENPWKLKQPSHVSCHFIHLTFSHSKPIQKIHKLLRPPEIFWCTRNIKGSSFPHHLIFERRRNIRLEIQKVDFTFFALRAPSMGERKTIFHAREKGQKEMFDVCQILFIHLKNTFTSPSWMEGNLMNSFAWSRQDCKGNQTRFRIWKIFQDASPFRLITVSDGTMELCAIQRRILIPRISWITQSIWNSNSTINFSCGMFHLDSPRPERR